MTTFDLFFAQTINAEGELSTDRSDPGNWTGGAVGRGECRGTKYGISAAAFPSLDIPNICLETAQALYRKMYWMPIAGERLPVPIALIVGDCAVNQGVGAACVILQESIGAEADGMIGPKTIGIACQCEDDPMPIIIEIAARRAVRYAQGDMTRYGLGWMRRLVRVAFNSHAPTP